MLEKKKKKKKVNFSDAGASNFVRNKAPDLEIGTSSSETKAGKLIDRMDKLPGGKGDLKYKSNFDPEEIKMGIETEMEHTKDQDLAMEIAFDHLAEDPKYYSKLKKAGLADELE